MDEQELRDQRSQLVVKDNYLIQKVRYNLTPTQQRFIAFLISKIKPTDEDFKEYSIRVEDFCLLTGIDKNHFYSEFKAMIDDIDANRTGWIETDKEIYKLRWFDDTSYVKGEGIIKVILTRRLKKYLIGLTQNFTEYELYNILALKSKYSIRLFELFKSYAYQKSKEFDIDNLKHLLMAEKYTNFKDFRRRVLEPSKDEINEYTELKVEYEPIKKGNKVVTVKFKIDRKEFPESYQSYRRTIDRITSKEKQVDGQMTIFDL